MFESKNIVQIGEYAYGKEEVLGRGATGTVYKGRFCFYGRAGQGYWIGYCRQGHQAVWHPQQSQEALACMWDRRSHSYQLRVCGAHACHPGGRWVLFHPHALLPQWYVASPHQKEKYFQNECRVFTTAASVGFVQENRGRVSGDKAEGVPSPGSENGEYLAVESVWSHHHWLWVLWASQYRE